MSGADGREPSEESGDTKHIGESDPIGVSEDGGPLGKGLPWRAQRAEIAEEPGNHGRFAFGCSIAVAIVLVAFFVLRMFVMR